MARPSPYPFNHLAAVRHLRGCDDRMADLITRVGRFRLPLEAHELPFHSLLRAIVYQQLHGSAAAAILGRVHAQVGGGGLPSPEQMLAAPEDVLRATGLSRQKIAAVRDLAEKTAAGVVPGWKTIESMNDDEIVARLTEVRGVGVWTVQMMLIFRLGRPDVLPTLDYGVQQGYQLAYRKRHLPKPRELAAFGERWRPWRSVASWYFWQAVHLHRDAIREGRAARSRGAKRPSLRAAAATITSARS